MKSIIKIDTNFEIFEKKSNRSITMQFHLVLISNPIDDEYNLIYSSLENIYELLVQKLQAGSQFDKEQLLPLTEIQKYAFFYKIGKLIFCIIAKTEDHNYFFNEIPFLKFKTQQCKVFSESYSLESLESQLQDWFNPFLLEKDLSLDIINSLFKNESDLEILIYFLFVGKKILFISTDKMKFSQILPLLHLCSPHRYLHLVYSPQKDENFTKFDIIFNDKELKLEDEFVYVNFDKFTIKYKNNKKLTNVLSNININNSNNFKNEFRQIIINATKLLELFQGNFDESFKTKSIDSLKKDSGADFQLVIDLASSINKRMEYLIMPYTKIEKKYTSFLNDF